MKFSTARPEYRKEGKESSETGNVSGQKNEGKTVTKKTIIEHLELKVELKKLKELKKLFELIDEIEDYTNSNGTDEIRIQNRSSIKKGRDRDGLHG